MADALFSNPNNFYQDLFTGFNTGVDTSGPSWLTSIAPHGFGTGIGGILGTGLGLALAPFTGGASALIGGALGGLGGNLLGDAFAGESIDPLSALISGIGGGALGGIGGELFGGAAGGAAGTGTDTIAGVGGETALSAADPFGTSPLAGIGSEIGSQIPTQALTESIAPAASLGITGTPTDTGGFASGSATVDMPTFGAGPGGVTDVTGATPADTPIDQQIADWSTYGGTPSAAPSGPIPGADAGVPGSFDAAQTAVNQAGGPVTFDPTTGANTAPNAPSLPKQAMDWIKANKDWLGPGLMGVNFFKQALFPGAIPGMDTLQRNSQLAGQIAGNFGSGNLTPQQQAMYDRQLAGQIAALKSRFASMGLSGSPMETQAINDASNAIFASTAQLINQNASTALSAIGAANAPTLAIANQSLQDDAELSKAIAFLAASAIGASGHA